MIKYIWAQDRKGLIGSDNGMPWYVKEELNHFATMTKNKIIVMGNNTFKSLPNKNLKNKEEIIVFSREMLDSTHNVSYFNDVDKFINKYGDEDVFVIGGLEMFEIFSKFVNELHISVIDNIYKGNLYINLHKMDNEIKIFNKIFTQIEKTKFETFTYYWYVCK